MYHKKELEVNILYSKLKIREIIQKKKLTDQKLLDICTLNLLQDSAKKELKEFDD